MRNPNLLQLGKPDTQKVPESRASNTTGGKVAQLVFKAYKLRPGDYKHRKTAIQQVILAQLDNDNDSFGCSRLQDQETLSWLKKYISHNSGTLINEGSIVTEAIQHFAVTSTL